MANSEKTSVPIFNRARFERRFDALSEIGRTETGAVHRPFGTQADIEARAWLTTLAEEAGFTVEVDPVGNLWGTQDCPGNGSSDQRQASADTTLPAIVIGSHHDSVPDGGRFDGALGVLMAIEVIQSLREQGVQTVHPLQFVSFTAEEPNPFDLSTLGSRAVAGRLTAERLQAAQDWDGRPLAQAMTAVGGDLEQASAARKSSDDIAAFLELHIEQGRRLEKTAIPIGVVTDICGIYRENIRVLGEANHAGTTQIEDRHDALLASSEMVLAVEQLLRNRHNVSLVATVGRFAISPNAMNIIPGACEWSLEIRGGDMATVYSFRDDCLQAFAEIAARRGVQTERLRLLDQQPQPLADGIVRSLRDAAAELEIPTLDLVSMAGHDATHIASFTRAGMLFVPSIDGKSHCKEEASRMEDIEQAFYVLAAATMSLDGQLNAD